MLTVPQTLQAQAAVAVQKVDALKRPGGFLVSAVLAGAYIGIGIVVMVSTAGPLVAAGDGSARLISGLVFGIALTLVVFAGADLATSAMMVLPIGTLMRSITLGRAVGALLATFALNLVGAFIFALLVFLSGVVSSSPPAAAMLADMLAIRADQTPLELFTRGILCNALVCLAIWMGARVSSEVARIVLIFVAITAFISSGFEHVVANMTTYSLGLLMGDPNGTAVLFAGNMLWVGLGNLVGGGLVIGAGYWLVGGRPGFAPGQTAGAEVTSTVGGILDE